MIEFCMIDDVVDRTYVRTYGAGASQAAYRTHACHPWGPTIYMDAPSNDDVAFAAIHGANNVTINPTLR